MKKGTKGFSAAATKAQQGAVPNTVAMNVANQPSDPLAIGQQVQQTPAPDANFPPRLPRQFRPKKGRGY